MKLPLARVDVQAYSLPEENESKPMSDPIPEEQSADLVAGDVVRLNSGGPKMTLLSDQKGGKAKCQWFDRNGKMHNAEFEIAALTRWAPKPDMWQ